MASFIGATIAKKAFNVFAKDRNILIPLDDITNTSIITDQQLKQQFKPTPKRGVKRKPTRNVMEKILERE
jgi:hypothetical protein